MALAVACALSAAGLARGQSATQPAPADDQPPIPFVHPPHATRPADLFAQYKGRPVEAVRVIGNRQVSTPIVLNAVRTKPGDSFDPATVEEDYQRIYKLKRFANVEARVEPTPAGVIVVFAVTEQRQITGVAFRGNKDVKETDLTNLIDVKPGDAIDPFRINLARQAIENLYRSKAFPFTHVKVDQDTLARDGRLIFDIVEGPRVRIRNIAFPGAKSFTSDRLKDQIKTATWIPIFRPGAFDPDQVDADIASLRKFYQDRGFFDAKVGRKLIFSPDDTQLQMNFVVDEGARYIVDAVRFTGDASLPESTLRKDMRLTVGRSYDQDWVDADLRKFVKDYSPLGFINQPGSTDPDYLTIEPKTIFGDQPGHVTVVYAIHEGKPFRINRILVRGNEKTQDKVALRELRVFPGQRYNSGEIADAADRLRGTPYFSGAQITPIGNQPDSRDLLVQVREQKTASFNIGAGVNSNGGIGANLTYEQRNFDIGNWPTSFRDLFSDRAFTGAGQDFRASFEPGQIATNASLRFSDPYLFDQPYSFTGEGYIRERIREDYDENRYGGRISFGKRFDYIYSALLTFRGEDVEITHILQPQLRPPEVVLNQGHHTLTSVGIDFRRDTTNHGPLTYKGSNLSAGAEIAGALGGQYQFYKFNVAGDYYRALYNDLLDRRTVLGLHANAGFVTPDAPFFERFYGGGIGSLRGFQYRGVGPRDGLDLNPIGGDFILTTTAELNFPVYGDNLRAVAFTDIGTVERHVEISTIRSSVGAGVRLILPFLSTQAPLAIDFAYPVSKARDDQTSFISFSFGVSQ